MGTDCGDAISGAVELRGKWVPLNVGLAQK